MGPGPRAALALALAALVLAGGARASVQLDTYREHEALLDVAGATVTAAVPFHLAQAGKFYAKLLVTPTNPVNPGTPNGTLAPDGRAGATGWWVAFHLADAAGAPLLSDAKGRPIDPALGAAVDSTPTRIVDLEGGRPYQLVAVIHVPETAANGTYRVPFALVFREDAGAPSGNGGRLEQARAFTQVIRVANATGTQDPGGGAGGGGTPGGGGGAGTPRAGPSPGLSTPALLGLVAVSLVVAGIALAAASVALLLVLRELRALRGGAARRRNDED